MSQITKIVGKPCSASDGNMNNSVGGASGKPRNLASGHAKGGSWPAGAHQTGVELSKAIPKYGSKLGASAGGCKGVEVNNEPGKHGSYIGRK